MNLMGTQWRQLKCREIALPISPVELFEGFSALVFPNTDTLYIDLSERPSTESDVLNENLTIDFDDEGRPVGITVEHYSQTVTIPTIEVSLPGELPPTSAVN